MTMREIPYKRIDPSKLTDDELLSEKSFLERKMQEHRIVLTEFETELIGVKEELRKRNQIRLGEENWCKGYPKDSSDP